MKKKLQPHLIAIGALVASGLLVCIAGYFLVIAPQNTKSSSLTEEIANAKTQSIVAAGAQARPVAFHASDLFRLAKAMPNANDMSGIILDLADVARKSSVQLTAVRPAANVPLGLGYSAIPISITVSGSYNSISKFMGLLRRAVRLSATNRMYVNGRLFDADQLQLAPFSSTTGAAPSVSGSATSATPVKNPAASTLLTATVALDAFVYAGLAPVTPVVGLPASGSPTTTGSGT